MGGVTAAEYTFTTNIVGSFNVLRAAATCGVERVVFTSSREVYGEPINLPVDEDSPLLAINSYGASKVAGEAYCRVRVMEPHENAFGPDFEGSMRRLRSRLATDGTFAAAAPAPALRAPDAIIPRSIFDALPDAALVSFHWEFHVSGACALPPKST
jgi:hypothetical protein